MSDEKFEKLDDVIAYAQENGDISAIFLWADEYQYEGMQKADADKIINALWSVFDKVKGGEYDPNQQYLASALRVIVEWAADQGEAVDLNLHDNFDAYVSRCIENDDMVEAMNLGLCVRLNGDINFYKKLAPSMIEKANSEWGWSDLDHEAGIKQILTQHDLTKEDAKQILKIAQENSTKKVLKDITREYEWRSEAWPDDYGSFHDRADWTTSSME
ncbi:hypothetical protein N9Q20_00350 [Amylibacter sp.]|nr:hypothetical protein [Amylibacter sp.]